MWGDVIYDVIMDSFDIIFSNFYKQQNAECVWYLCNQLMKIIRMVKIVCILTHILKHLIFVLYDI